LLRNGKVLIAGGKGELFDHVSATELYDPVTARWTGTGQMKLGRYDHTATLLANGDVLVIGSDTQDSAATAEIYSTTMEKWSLLRQLVVERRGHTATLLLNGKILILGGDPANRVEFYSPNLGHEAP
jgi:N-acetylneuraminic acid mutarotase